MRVLELKVPPLGILLVTVLLMALCARVLPAVAFTIPFQEFIALVLAVAGATTSILGVLSFRRAGTTVNPLKPDASTSLVCSGVYKRTRNPMYLGFLMILLGWSICLSNALALMLVPMFVVYMNRFQIEPEERALRSHFGQEFVAYTRSVGRWL